MWKEFLAFIKEYKIAGLAMAFIMGTASTDLVKSLVNNIIMPFVSVFIPNGGWKEAILSIGPLSLPWGAFLADLLNFVILAFVVFFIAKKLFKEAKVEKK
ncbi:MAG: MscL family protein [Candidatus Peregrinibacteria bacterium]|nr:MscL family protein [Candidatus Peregrinibacteria bacterium]